MNLREGKTVIIAMVNGGFVKECFEVLEQFLPRILELTGPETYVYMGDMDLKKHMLGFQLLRNMKANPGYWKSSEISGGAADTSQVIYSAMQHMTREKTDYQNVIIISNWTNSNVGFELADTIRTWLYTRNAITMTSYDHYDMLSQRGVLERFTYTIRSPFHLDVLLAAHT